MNQCKAMSKRSGERCRKHSSKGLNVCAMHGGKSLRGVDSMTFKTGRYSKYLPDRLVERYEEALNDVELMRLDDEIALVDAKLQDVLEQLPAESEGPGARQQLRDAHQRLEQAIAREDANATHAGVVMLGEAIASGRDECAAWGMILELIEQRRKLVDTERRRMLDEDQFISVERLMILVAALTDIIRRNVASREERAAVSNEIRCLVSGN